MHRVQCEQQTNTAEGHHPESRDSSDRPGDLIRLQDGNYTTLGRMLGLETPCTKALISLPLPRLAHHALGLQKNAHGG